MKRKLCLIIAITLSTGVYVFGEELRIVNNLTVLDTKPIQGKKCQTRNNTGTTDQGLQCICTDDPDGDPYLVWVCK